jgi:hypothetical protein
MTMSTVGEVTWYTGERVSNQTETKVSKEVS